MLGVDGAALGVVVYGGDDLARVAEGAGGGWRRWGRGFELDGRRRGGGVVGGEVLMEVGELGLGRGCWRGGDLEPEAAAADAELAGHELGEGLGVDELVIGGAETDAGAGVVEEPGVEEVLFGPVLLAVEEPLFGVAHGEEDVVDMDGEAGLELGEDAEIEVYAVVAGVDGVCGVDEEDVAVVEELVVVFERDGLGGLFDEVEVVGGELFEEIAGVGFDAGDMSEAVFCDGLESDEGGEAAADFEDVFGLEEAEDGVVGQGVAAGEHGVIPEEGIG